MAFKAVTATVILGLAIILEHLVIIQEVDEVVIILDKHAFLHIIFGSHLLFDLFERLILPDHFDDLEADGINGKGFTCVGVEDEAGVAYCYVFAEVHVG